MASSLFSIPSTGKADCFCTNDQTFIDVSEIIHRVSLYIASSQLNQQQKQDSDGNKYLNLSSDRSSLGFGGMGLKTNYDIADLVPPTLPGDHTPAKALLLDQLNLLVLNTRSLFEQNPSSNASQYLFKPQPIRPSISNTTSSSSTSNISGLSDVNASGVPSFHKSLSTINISPPADAGHTPFPPINPDGDSFHTKSLLTALFNKVQFQQNEIEIQRATVQSLENDLATARSTISAITDSIQPNQRRFIDTDLLDRELTKSQNANRAFQKALREIGEVVIAVAQGDLSKKVTVHAQEMDPEIVKFKETINTMMDQLQTFASEVTRVATEVAGGTLGGQAEGDGTVGVWRELTDNVNVMASNLTNQVREIADVTRAVAQGDLSRKINVHAQGEILELQKTINTMVDQLRTFAFEVTRVARETGVEGRLGGQAQIDGVEGIWRELTDNGKHKIFLVGFCSF